MRHAIWITVAGSALTMLLAAAATPKTPSKTPPPPKNPGDTPAARLDVKNLQGAWRVVRAENNGMNVKGNLGYEEFVIEGKTTKVMYRGEERKSSFEIDPSKKPKWITFITPKGTEIPAIYELKGDKWRVLSRNAGRPEKWDDPGCALMEYERVKPAAAATQASSRPSATTGPASRPVAR
jgi:uncharacterized protein (TIGR03067 family)